MSLFGQGIFEALRLLVTGDPEVWQITWLSLQISATATLLSLLIGVPLGALLALSRFPGRAVAVSLVNTGMRLSARNIFKGKILEVTKGATTAHVKIDVGGGTVVFSSITNEAVESLGLRVGDSAYAVIKASDVMQRLGLQQMTLGDPAEAVPPETRRWTEDYARRQVGEVHERIFPLHGL